jgi:hypothetical protein
VAYKGRTSKDEIEELSPKEKLKIQEELILKVQAYNLTRRLVVIKKTQ